ncbi:hypothetical protein IN07_18370 [Modestobacter caceresii]|uniref:Uncharacterized protein n=1 Tax=Modestobacter caceresii TaxID=1522368 RepID=A0A098Y490_9ACTN|nr:hypothetical protein [Modestobacter caceresii]KGH45240.1 hypothetical protein IN07_18370 [Modestobacter caceresii]
MDIWALVITTLIGGVAGWFGNVVRYAGERKQKREELDQKDAELAQTKQRDADDRVKAREERELELIDKARELLKSDDEDDKIAGRYYLMGLIRVQEDRSQLVDEILNQFSQKEFGAPVAQIRAADTRHEDYVVVVGDTVAIRDEVVAETAMLDDGGTEGTDDLDDDDDDAGEGRDDDEGPQAEGHPGDPEPGQGRAGSARA